PRPRRFPRAPTPPPASRSRSSCRGQWSYAQPPCGLNVTLPRVASFRIEVSRERVVLPNGRELWLDIVHHPGAAAVVPFTGDAEVALIRQYRHAAGGTILEVPAGKLDPGESPERCAERELAEEAGYSAGQITA